MPRFSIKDLILAMTLVATGLFLEFALLRWDGDALSDQPPIVILFFYVVTFGTGGAMIGTGLLAPFGTVGRIAGATMGFGLGVCFVLLMSLMGI
jgi:hypothetical protein